MRSRTMSEQEWDEVLDTHLKGTFLCCKYVVPTLIEQHSGKVVNISSVAAIAASDLALTIVLRTRHHWSDQVSCHGSRRSYNYH